jgi:hypothetical protein
MAARIALQGHQCTANAVERARRRLSPRPAAGRFDLVERAHRLGDWFGNAD